MQLRVDPSLVFHVFPDSFFVPRSSNGVDVKAGGPELATPQYLSDLWVTIKEFSRREAFDETSDFGGREGRNGLEQEVHMIFVCPYFNEGDFVVLGNRPTDVFEGFFDRFREDFLSASDGADEMVEEKRDIVGFPLMLAHGSMLPEE